MASTQMKIAAQYAAGATRTVLKVITDANPQKPPHFRNDAFWVVDRALVGKFIKGRVANVFINPHNYQSLTGQKVWIGIVQGYQINKHSGEFMVFETSEAACESAALVAAELGAVVARHAYKNRGPVTYYRLTEDGLTDVTGEINANEQEPL